MNLQTLLEAAKYLDYLDSSPQNGMKEAIYPSSRPLGGNVILSNQQASSANNKGLATIGDANSLRLNYYQQKTNGIMQHPRSSPAIAVPHLASPSSMSTCSPISAFSSSSSSSLSSSSSSYCGEGETNFQLLSHVVPSSLGGYIDTPPMMITKSPLIQGSVSSMSPSPTSSYSRHRELHKTLEKNRRAHLRRCFEILKAELPTSECGSDKKTSHINIIKSAIRYVLALKRQERENDNEVQRLTKIKTQLTENLSMLRKDQIQSQLSGTPSSSTSADSADWTAMSYGTHPVESDDLVGHSAAIAPPISSSTLTATVAATFGGKIDRSIDKKINLDQSYVEQLYRENLTGIGSPDSHAMEEQQGNELN